MKFGKYEFEFCFSYYNQKLKKEFVKNLKAIIEKSDELIEKLYKETLIYVMSGMK